MLFFWVFGAVFPVLVSGAHFSAGFFAVAFSAEGLEVVDVVCASAGDIVDVVDFQVVCGSALCALVVVSVECFFAEVLWCAF